MTEITIQERKQPDSRQLLHSDHSSGPECVPALERPCVRDGQELGLLKDTDRYNQLGGSIGGPIWKNRVFAFFSYEGTEPDHPATGTGWYPTSQLAALAPAGSIASTFLNFPGAGVLGTVIRHCRLRVRGTL